MKKLTAFFLAFSTLFLLCACSGSMPEADKDLPTIRNEIITELSISDELTVEADRLTDLYGIKSEDISESGCFVTMSGVFPDEIIMVKATDKEASARIVEKLESKLEEFMNQAKDYDAESYALAQKCKVETNGLYVSLFLSAKSEEISEIYNSHFE